MLVVSVCQACEMFSLTLRAVSSTAAVTTPSKLTSLPAAVATSHFHTSGGPQESRIKFTYSHKPFYHTKKTNKALDEPLTAANRTFVQQVR